MDLAVRKMTLGRFGVENVGAVHENLPPARLVEASVRRREGMVSGSGALVVRTGKRTGRSPRDRFIVENEVTMETVDWGTGNKAFPSDRFGPDWTVISVPGLLTDPDEDGTESETFVGIDFERKVVLICGTAYAGEIKKSIFTVLNFVLPTERGVFPMHCSSNAGKEGDVALFFGLSGTGKTTLSADPERDLIGDDEHGWSDSGVFNFEGGCYAKTIDLSAEKEPQIWDAIRFGAVLENVVMDRRTREVDYSDRMLTENTRVAYPLEYIAGAVTEGRGVHPSAVLFLTADAFGVLPPISALTPSQAASYFLSAYTAKLAGTEAEMESEVEATFSTCFGAPFLPLPATAYAEMLSERLEENGVRW